jgi:hypothetical protein
MAIEETLATARKQRRVFAHPAAVLVGVTAAVALLGIPAAFAWAAVVPRVAVVITGHGAAEVINPETKAFIAADGWFCVIGVIGGVLAGVVGYLTAVRRSGPAAVAGLILGGLAASIAAWWIGRNIGLASFRTALYLGQQGAVLHAPLVLRAHTALVIWPLTSALVVGLAELLLGQRDEQAVAPPGGGAAPSRATPY